MTDRASDMQTDVKESARRIWLAGLGVYVLMQEEGGRLFKTLVDRGREMEARNPMPRLPVITEQLDDARQKARTTVDRLTKELDSQVTMALRRLGVPTRDEIATLAKRVEALTASVEKLRPKTRAMTKTTGAATMSKA